MPKRVAPTKLTAGGGFLFEDQVAAYFLAKLLAGQPPLNPADGRLARIAFQVQAAGWALDDVLLTLDRGGESRRWAFSVKSNAQFTAKTAPPDFVAACWEQLLKESSPVFDETTDHLGICVAPPAAKVTTALAGLRLKAQTHQASELPAHIATPRVCSQEERDLFKSFACPSALAAKHSIGEEGIGRLLALVLVRPFDFQGSQSRDAREAHKDCRGALESGDSNEALSLWEALLAIGGRYRVAGGSLDLRKLRAELGGRFRLKGQPQHAADWKRIQDFSKSKLDTIPGLIGDKVALPRKSALDEIEKAFTSTPALTLLGASGSGKTVAAKDWLGRADGERALWLDAQDLTSWESRLHLQHPAAELLAAFPGSSRLVVDGLDRVYDEQAFKSLSALLHGAGFGQDCAWKLLVTCQPDEWPRVQAALRAANLGGWQTRTLELPDADDLAPVWKEFPALRAVCQRQDLKAVVCKPKILDVLARQIAEGKTLDAARWLGESDLIAWFWENEIRKTPQGLTRMRFTQQLAERQGELVSHEVPSDGFGDHELSVVESLIADRICVRREDRVAFAHDIYGDWGRQRALISRTPDLPALAALARSPLWHRAIRLYGVHLLEKRGVADWRNLLGQAGASADAALLNARDLLLESLVVAANSWTILERAWPDLAANDGRLLKLFLRRFLYIATMPNPAFIAAMREMKSEGSDTFAATRNRIPYWPYWFPMLRFVAGHFKEMAGASVEVAEICDIWLRGTRKGVLLRAEAAAMALELAGSLVDEREYDHWGSAGKEAAKVVYRAALAATDEDAEAVALFVRKACRRVDPPPPPPAEPETAADRPSILRGGFPPLYRRRERLPPPWPDGPRRPVDDAFREICLDTDAAAPLVEHCPLLAKEAFLALLIEPPESEEDARDFHDLEMDYQLIKRHDWFPPSYFNGPFVVFLRRHPQEGLDLILRLTNFVAERMRERASARTIEMPELTLALPDGPRRYAGGGRVYAFYCGMSPGPRVVENALMSLEFYLYEQIEAGKDVLALIDAIFKGSSSVAALGVLVALGKKHPELFKTALKPLLARPELYQWDMQISLQSPGVWPMSPLRQDSFVIQKMAEWHGMPHRKMLLRDLSIRLFILDEEVRAFLTQARQEWEKGLAADEDDRLRNLAARFDFANYRYEEDEQGARWLFTPPKELEERNAPHAVELRKSQLLTTFPMNCRQILNGEAALQPAQLEEFWGIVQEIHGMEELSADSDPIRRENGICGGIAVLLCRHKDWLDSHPERKAWCARRVSELVRNPPAPPRFDSPVSRMDWGWNRFCAQAVPVLWAENPASSEWRTCAAVLATGPNHEVLSYLFHAAVAQRAALGGEFSSLLHLALKWAAEIATWHDKQGRTSRGDLADLNRRQRALVESFARGEIPAGIPSWKSIAAPRTRRRASRTDRLRSLEPIGFESYVLEAVLQVWPGLSQAANETERAQWVAVWRNALQVILDKFGPPSELEIEGHPYDLDNWLLGRIAEIALEMRDDEHPEEFWRPVLDLGSPGHMWIDDFLRGWFMAGKRSDSKDSVFFRRWQAMLDYADSSPLWRRADRFSRHYIEENWLHLLGLSGLSNSFWSAERRSLAVEMKPRWRAWAQAHLRSGSSARSFLYFLRRAGAAEIISDGLVWLRDGIDAAGAGYWNEREIIQEMASFLDFAWHSHSASIRADARAMQAFTAILNALVAKGDSVALQLRDSLGAAA